MTLDIYQVDAFTKTIFKGNPAAVVPLSSWLEPLIMQQIAFENNLAETAFFVESPYGFLIRWFTPTEEVELCGHATLAAAHVLYHHLGFQKPLCQFETMHRGVLSVEKSVEGYSMDFPSDTMAPTNQQEREIIKKIVRLEPIDSIKGSDDYLVILSDQHLVTGFIPDFESIRSLNARGLIISAAGSQKTDFISRCFFPRYGINEDAVTGSAHTLLAPYWAKKLGKNKLKALQASQRTGIIECNCQGNRVLLGGSAKTYLKGKINITHGL